MFSFVRHNGDKGIRIIGIAGNIGAGKSVVSRILRCNGFIVYDCDREASLLMNNDEALRLSLEKILGKDCYLPDGSLNKTYVSSKIFCDDALRCSVNEVVHEAVRNDFMKMATHAGNELFVESAVMSTSGLCDICDGIWLVAASEETRLRRVMLRNNMPEQEVRKRMDSQAGEIAALPSEKVVVIENDQGSEVLRRVLQLALPLAEPEYFEFYLQSD